MPSDQGDGSIVVAYVTTGDITLLCKWEYLAFVQGKIDCVVHGKVSQSFDFPVVYRPFFEL